MLTPRSPSCRPQASRVGRIGKRSRQPGMNAPRNGGTGERVQQVVGAGALGRLRRSRSSAAKPVATRSPRRRASPGVVASALDLLGLAQRAFSVEPPERDLGMDLEDTCGGAASSRRHASTSRIFGASMNSCFDTLRGGSRTGERDPAGLAVVRGRERGPRRDRKYRGLSRAEKRPHRVLGRPAARAGALRQADRNVDRNDARRLRRGEHVGKARHDAYAYVAIGGADECHDPAGPAAVDTREPSIIQDFSHLSREWHRSHSVGRLVRWI